MSEAICLIEVGDPMGAGSKNLQPVAVVTDASYEGEIIEAVEQVAKRNGKDVVTSAEPHRYWLVIGRVPLGDNQYWFHAGPSREDAIEQFVDYILRENDIDPADVGHDPAEYAPIVEAVVESPLHIEIRYPELERTESKGEIGYDYKRKS